MVKQWLDQKEKLEGSGTLRNPEGESEGVSYRVFVQQHMRERTALGKPPEDVGDKFELSGEMYVALALKCVDLKLPLILTLQDGRELGIIFSKTSEPGVLWPFVVSDERDFFTRK